MSSVSEQKHRAALRQYQRKKGQDSEDHEWTTERCLAPEDLTERMQDNNRPGRVSFAARGRGRALERGRDANEHHDRDAMKSSGSLMVQRF